MKDSIVIKTIGCASLAKDLEEKGFSVSNFESLESLLDDNQQTNFRAFVIRSTAIANRLTEDVVRILRQRWPFVDVLVWAPRSSADLVLETMKAGAKEIVLVENSSEVVIKLEAIISSQTLLPKIESNKKARRTNKYEGLISRDPKMADIFEGIEQVADTLATVLVLGETGTGKELVARAIHRRSGRKGRFVAINCAAIPENLINSELFGHVKGAFTGANTEKKGLFRYAENGSLFLDEIGNMPLTTQHHLLRVLQENKVRPVGAHDEIEVNARIIAATSRPLSEYIERGLFREDLYYRLDVFRLELPPLRERGDDIIYLFMQFLQKFSKQYKLSRPIVTERLLDELLQQEWKGNVRQLVNTAERLVLTYPGKNLTRQNLLKALKPKERLKESSNSNLVPSSEGMSEEYLNLPLKKAIERKMIPFERNYLERILEKNNGKIADSAEQAGISRRTLLRKMKTYGIEKKSFKKNGSPDNS